MVSRQTIYNKRYYKKKKANDPKWYADHLANTRAGNKRRYDARKIALMKKHFINLREMFDNGNYDEAKEYLEENFTMKTTKNGRSIL